MASKHFKDNGALIGKTGLKVEVKNNNIDQALKALKRKIMHDGMIKDLRRMEYYEKPSVRRRREKSEAVKRNIKRQQQQLEQL